MHHADTQTFERSLNEARQQLEDVGCVIAAGLCDPAFVASLLTVSRNRSEAVMTALGSQTIGIGSAAGFDAAVAVLQVDHPLTARRDEELNDTVDLSTSVQ